MDAKTELPLTPPSAENLFRPWRAVLSGPHAAIGLIRQNQWNLGRRITFLVAAGWLPLLIITALLNLEGVVSFIRDYRVHSRMLIAVPALLVGEMLMESRFRAVIEHIRRADPPGRAGSRSRR